jgi:glycosyltransferase involved in cell wall biosynthesis
MANKISKPVKTLFVGPFAPPYTGDGVKNNNLREGFLNAGYSDIEFFDTIRRQGGAFSHYFKLLKLLFGFSQIILSLNRTGRYVIISLYWFLSIFSRKKAVLYVVGGTFDKQLEQESRLWRKVFVRMVNKMEGVFAESIVLKNGLEKCGIKNVELIYNPRKDNGMRWSLNAENRFKGVFVSRVTDVKGVFDLMDAVEGMHSGDMPIVLDVYGPIDPDFEDEFKKRVANSNKVINYRGVISSDDVQQVLCHYHFLALPTYHFGEGLPGILVEAGMAGIPIIITRFNALPEYFVHLKSALFVEVRDVSGLAHNISELVQDNRLAQEISQGVNKVVEPFKIENVLDQSVRYLISRQWQLSKANEASLIRDKVAQELETKSF